jgi:ribosome-associated translation inhibitor RaiA
MKIGSKLLRATCEHEDLRNAVTDVKDELQRQIKKLKGKRG